jgi:hypothetical protein
MLLLACLFDSPNTLIINGKDILDQEMTSTNTNLPLTYPLIASCEERFN